MSYKIYASVDTIFVTMIGIFAIIKTHDIYQILYILKGIYIAVAINHGKV